MTAPSASAPAPPLLARTQSGLVADALTAATGRADRARADPHRGRRRAARRWPRSAAPASSSARCATRCCADEVDLAVHSLKDLPTAPADGIALAAVPLREDPRDVVVARDGLTLGELPQGARVGTGSPRRVAQLAGARPRRRAGRGARQRRHPDRQGPLRRARRRRAGPCRAGPAGPAGRGHRGARPDPGAAGTGPGRPGGRVPRSDTDLVATCVRRALDDPPTRACVEASERCSPSSRPAARRRSAHWPKLRKATTVTNSGSARSPSPSTARCPCAVPPPGRSTTRSAWARSSPPRCSPRAQHELISTTHAPQTPK